MDATRYTVKVAAQAVAAHVNEICEEDGDDADMIGLVERLILAEMTNGLRDVPPKRGPGRPRKAAEEKYVEVPVPEEPSSEEEEVSSIVNNARRDIKHTEQKHALVETAVEPETATEVEPETATAVEESEVPDGEGDEEDDAWADEPENWDE